MMQLVCTEMQMENRICGKNHLHSGDHLLGCNISTIYDWKLHPPSECTFDVVHRFMFALFSQVAELLTSISAYQHYHFHIKTSHWAS